MVSTLLWLLLLLLHLDPLAGFTPPSRTATSEKQSPPARSRNLGCTINTLRVLSSLLSKADDDNEQPENFMNKSSEGMELAEKFRREVADRSKKTTGTNDAAGPTIPSTEDRPFAAPTPKFVGQSPLFSEPPGAQKQQPYEREFNLASIFEKTLLLQAVGLASAIAFVVYTGFVGGITDGSDRSYGGIDDVDDYSVQMLDQLRGDNQAELDSRGESFFSNDKDTSNGSVYL